MDICLLYVTFIALASILSFFKSRYAISRTQISHRTWKHEICQSILWTEKCNTGKCWKMRHKYASWCWAMLLQQILISFGWTNSASPFCFLGISTHFYVLSLVLCMCDNEVGFLYQMLVSLTPLFPLKKSITMKYKNEHNHEIQKRAWGNWGQIWKESIE